MSENKTQLELINEHVAASVAANKYKGDIFNMLTVAITDVVPQSGYSIADDGTVTVTVDDSTVIASFTPPADATVKGAKYAGKFLYNGVEATMPQWTCKRLERYAKGPVGKKSKGTSNAGALAAAFGITKAA